TNSLCFEVCRVILWPNACDEPRAKAPSLLRVGRPTGADSIALLGLLAPLIMFVKRLKYVGVVEALPRTSWILWVEQAHYCELLVFFEFLSELVKRAVLHKV